MLEMELLICKLLNQHPDDLRTIEFVPCCSPDLITEVIEQLEMSWGQDKLHAVICRPSTVISGHSPSGHGI
jgi:hypothetical protein